MTKKKRKRRHGSVLYTPIALLLIVIIAIFGVSVFFRVSTIEVVGAEKYTVEQILAVSGIETGDNLFFIDEDKVVGNIQENLPYLSEVVIEKTMPDAVKITVIESRSMAVIRYDSEWWVIDQTGRVLEKTDNLGASGKIKVSGLTVAALGIGETIVPEEDDQTKFKYLTDVLCAVEGAGIAGDITTLDVSNIANISFEYNERFTVILGSGEDVEKKIARVLSVIEQLSDSDVGRIDVSDEEKYLFIPD